MDLFVRETGPVEAPVVVFLHGGHRSGWSWDPVVERLPGYRCLVPDLPHYGRSVARAPFQIGPAAEDVARLIRARAGGGRAHVVGYSLGAQVGAQLLATEPDLVDRAVLCGTVVNTLPGVRLTQLTVRQLARSSWFRAIVDRLWVGHHVAVPPGRITEYHTDLHTTNGPRFADIVSASAGFTPPRGLARSRTPTLFLAGADEIPLVRRWASALARPMPNAVNGVAVGMRHDWPLSRPDLFADTVDAWLSGAALPEEIALS